MISVSHFDLRLIPEKVLNYTTREQAKHIKQYKEANRFT